MSLPHYHYFHYHITNTFTTTLPLLSLPHYQYFHYHITNTFTTTLPILSLPHYQYFHYHITNTFTTTLPILSLPHYQYFHYHITNTFTSPQSLADQAWALLKKYLEIHDPPHNYQLQKCVARKLLLLGHPLVAQGDSDNALITALPQWLVDNYKVLCRCGTVEVVWWIKPCSCQSIANKITCRLLGILMQYSNCSSPTVTCLAQKESICLSFMY